MASDNDLDDTIEDEGGVVGAGRLEDITGIPKDFILGFARDNDVPTIAGGYAFTADTAADVVDAFDDLCDEDGDLDEDEDLDDEEDEEHGCDVGVGVDCYEK